MRIRAKTKRQGPGISRTVLPHLRGAAHYAADGAIKIAKRQTRLTVRSVGLGGLANAIGATSSLEKRRTQSNTAWGAIFARGGINSRANQALMAYTEGALIRPTGGRKWLAYATPAAGRLARVPLPRIGRRAFGNVRNTPGINRNNLVFVRFSANRAALVLKNASVSRKTGRAKAAGKRIGRGADRKDFVVMFWLIRFTARAARFNQGQIVRQAAQAIPRLAQDYQRQHPLR